MPNPPAELPENVLPDNVVDPEYMLIAPPYDALFELKVHNVAVREEVSLPR